MFYLFVILVLTLCITTNSLHNHHKLLLVAFDGFRWDYTQYANTPYFDEVRISGSSVPYMNGVFPSVTLSSFYSIATGLYPESHGLVANKFYDPDRKDYFNYSRTESYWYEDGESEPIWVTAGKHGLKTATYYCPGIDAEIHGYRPDHYIPYNSSTPFEHKVDQVLKWLTDDDADFVILYFDQPDHVGHFTGPAPQSNETVAMIEYLDQVFGYLLQQLSNHGLSDSVNMIVISDHGMTNRKQEMVFDISDFINYTEVEVIICEGAMCQILPHDGKGDLVINKLVDSHPNITVYKKKDIPAHFHYKHNLRILPIVIMADEGWTIVNNRSFPSNQSRKGGHGYDNRLSSMKPFFLAKGPDIKSNYTSEIFNQIDIYPLMCKLLGVEPNPFINGSLAVTGEMVELHLESTVFPSSSMLLVLTILGGVLVVMIVGMMILMAMPCCQNVYEPKPSSRAQSKDYMAL